MLSLEVEADIQDTPQNLTLASTTTAHGSRKGGRFCKGKRRDQWAWGGLVIL